LISRVGDTGTVGTPEIGGIVPTCPALCAIFLSLFGVIQENVSHIPIFDVDAGADTQEDAENDCVVGDETFCTQDN
tara:strand:+ start:11702 stop:11929 length:228 start_codon:yes stop_codon:yes gene_type:complete